MVFVMPPISRSPGGRSRVKEYRGLIGPEVLGDALAVGIAQVVGAIKDGPTGLMGPGASQAENKGIPELHF